MVVGVMAGQTDLLREKVPYDIDRTIDPFVPAQVPAGLHLVFGFQVLGVGAKRLVVRGQLGEIGGTHRLLLGGGELRGGWPGWLR